jgi:hypothetical protein
MWWHIGFYAREYISMHLKTFFFKASAIPGKDLKTLSLPRLEIKFI